MKKIFFLLIVLISLKSFSQDSNLVKISVVITFKELNYIGDFVHDNDLVFGDLADTIKVKYRGQADPTEATSVTITGTIGAWLAVNHELRHNPNAILTNMFKKVDDAMKLLTTQTYLIRTLAAYDAADDERMKSKKQNGKFRNRRTI